MRFTVSISPQHPAFEGHFPGAPITPGVVILEHLLRALREQDPAFVCKGVRKAKFLRPLRPGESVMAECDPVQNGAMRVRAWVGDDVLVEARLLIV